jgi:hypothetical protein
MRKQVTNQQILKILETTGIHSVVASIVKEMHIDMGEELDTVGK